MLSCAVTQPDRSRSLQQINHSSKLRVTVYYDELTCENLYLQETEIVVGLTKLNHLMYLLMQERKLFLNGSFSNFLSL